MAAVEAYQTANGRRYRVRYRKPDRTQTDKRGFRTRRDAELFLASVEISIARGEFVDASAARAPVGELGSVWIRDLTHVKPSYWRSLESTWRRHVEPRWGTVAVAAVRHSEVQSWVSGISDAGLSPSTAHRAYGILASILDVAVKDRRIMSNPARGVRLPRKVKREHTYLTDGQVASLALAAGRRGVLVLVLAYCGLRWGEAIGLRVKDLDMLRRRLNVTVNAVEVGGEIIVGTPKTHKRRSVPFPPTLAIPLAQACEGKGPNDLVFGDRPGVHLRRSKSDDGWFSDAVVAAGLPRLTPHDLRHTAASLAVRSGAT